MGSTKSRAWASGSIGFWSPETRERAAPPRASRGMRRTLLASVSTAALLLSVVAPAHADPLTWKPCSTGSKAECATLTVPVDWTKPDGPAIDLEISRRTADPAKRLGVLVYGEGGPGGTSAHSVQSSAIFSAAVTEKFDVIGVNARGYGDGYQLSCPDQAPATGLFTSQADMDRFRAATSAYAQACREQTGPLFDHVDTVDNARDLDAVRAALGEQKISFYGGSYGTLLGQQYAELFPGKVERLVLDSTMDHSIPDFRTFSATEAKAAEELFDQFVQWCAATVTCALHGTDIRATVTELQKRADAGELKDSAGKQLTPLSLDYLTAAAKSGKRAWPSVANGIKTLDTTGIAPLRNISEGTNGGFHGVLCRDWNMQIRDFADFQSITEHIGQVAPMTRFNSYPLAGFGCQGFVNTTNPPKVFAKSSLPTLVINARHDFKTVYPWATNLTGQTGWTLLTHDGDGHVKYFSSPCVKAATDRYLLTGELPAAGTHCAAEQAQGQQQEEPLWPEKPERVW
ncbi:alpha/beta fold hydrolase [Pseudonocardiaceae bacterium YIM PH 21723]|nr:alpha/beta fold hydrolase [Pseudonocardiaceae bacterium YIM PH 21723]